MKRFAIVVFFILGAAFPALAASPDDFKAGVTAMRGGNLDEAIRLFTRIIKAKDLTVCSSCSHVSSCTRCPGLAYMEGSMRGPSSADCEKSYYRTGIPSANMLRNGGKLSSAPLVQIQPLAAMA